MHAGSDSEILPERPPAGLKDGHMLVQMQAKIQTPTPGVLYGRAGPSCFVSMAIWMYLPDMSGKLNEDDIATDGAFRCHGLGLTSQISAQACNVMQLTRLVTVP